MVKVKTDILIHKPVLFVADYASNPDNAPVWYDNIKSVRWKTPKPLSIGSQVAFTAHFLGRHLDYTHEFTEYIPGQKLVMQTAEGPFPMETTYIWTAIDDNTTKMMLQNAGNPKGFSKFFSPIMSLMMRSANKKDLKKLKQILESTNHK
jgi:uncharacterized membrane protein